MQGVVYEGGELSVVSQHGTRNGGWLDDGCFQAFADCLDVLHVFRCTSFGHLIRRVESIGNEVALLTSGKKFDRRTEALTRNGRLKMNTTLLAELDVG